MSQLLINKYYKSTNPVNPKSLPNVPRPIIEAANSSIIRLQDIARTGTKRGNYQKETDETKLKIAKYASVNGLSTESRKFSKEFQRTISVSTIQSWVTRYKEQLKTEENPKTLLQHKRGAPTLLPFEIETQLKDYLQELRKNGGVVTDRIIRSVATAIIQITDPSLLSPNGYIKLSLAWAHQTAPRFGYVKRKATKSTKAEIPNKDTILNEFRDT